MKSNEDIKKISLLKVNYKVLNKYNYTKQLKRKKFQPTDTIFVNINSIIIIFVQLIAFFYKYTDA